MSINSKGPLTGMRVMDVSIMAAGPWTGALLGMLGAEALDVVRQVPAGGGATVRVRAFPARFSNMKLELNGIAPQVGEHTKDVLAAL